MNRIKTTGLPKFKELHRKKGKLQIGEVFFMVYMGKAVTQVVYESHMEEDLKKMEVYVKAPPKTKTDPKAPCFKGQNKLGIL